MAECVAQRHANYARAGMADGSALQRGAIGSLLNLCNESGQEEGNWCLDPRLWMHSAARLHAHCGTDPSLGVPMFQCLPEENGKNDSQFFECVFVSKDIEQHVSSMLPAVGLPVKAPLSFDYRSSHACGHVQRGSDSSSQSMATSASAPNLIVAGHDYLEKSVLSSMAQRKALALPPQNAYQLAHNRLMRPPPPRPEASSCSNRRDQVPYKKRSKALFSQPPSRAVTVHHGATHIEGLGPTSCALLPPQQSKPACAVEQPNTDTRECEEAGTAESDGVSLGACNYKVVCYANLSCAL